MVVRAELTVAQHQRRRLLSRAWGIVVVAWAFGRTLVVWAALADYGINPWAYLAIDLVCAAVDAVTTPRTVLSLIDARYRDAWRWGLASIVAFVIPDVYIFLATDHLPKTVIVVICLVVVLTLTVTVVGVVRRVRAGREELEAAVEADATIPRGFPPAR